MNLFNLDMIPLCSPASAAVRSGELKESLASVFFSIWSPKLEKERYATQNWPHSSSPCIRLIGYAITSLPPYFSRYCFTDECAKRTHRSVASKGTRFAQQLI